MHIARMLRANDCTTDRHPTHVLRSLVFSETIIQFCKTRSSVKVRVLRVFFFYLVPKTDPKKRMPAKKLANKTNIHLCIHTYKRCRQSNIGYTERGNETRISPYFRRTVFVYVNKNNENKNTVPTFVSWQRFCVLTVNACRTVCVQLSRRSFRQC